MNVPIEESIRRMVKLGKEGKAWFISLSESSAKLLKRGSAVHPLVSLQMEYSLFSRDAEAQGQIGACKERGMAMMAYAALGRGMLSAQVPKVAELAADAFERSCPAFTALMSRKTSDCARRLKSVLARFRARYRYDENFCALGHRPSDAEVGESGVFLARDALRRMCGLQTFCSPQTISREATGSCPPGAASGTRYPIGEMQRLNV